ncbi:MAG: hydroxymethylglutaryl-CoA synthase [Candidatus Helarchaeota archaeon]
MADIQIYSYGVYVPRYRITHEEIKKIWGHFQGKILEKAVMGYDEDTVTMAVEAGKNAIANGTLDRSKIRTIAIGCSSPPYALRSMAAEVAMAIGISDNIRILDFKESEKAGTTALLTCIDIVTNKEGYGLVIGTDAPKAIASDGIENTFGASAAAVLIGKGNGIAQIEGVASATVEFIADRFRKEGSVVVEDIGIPQYHQMAYSKSIIKAVSRLREDLGIASSEFQHVFIQGHDTREPLRVLKKLGIDKKLLYTETLNVIGDSAAASVLTGLVAILEKANPGERILCVSYGSGAGADAFSVLVKKKQQVLENIPIITTYLQHKQYLEYNQYLKFKELIELEE